MSPENVTRLKVLNSAPLDSWIALSEDESAIVAVGRTYAEASDSSERAGFADAVILKTPSIWAPFSVASANTL